MIAAGFLTLAGAGCLYLAFAAFAARAFPREPREAPPAQAVTVLKPLHGDEPRLYENLESLCRQTYAAPVQIVCGVQDPHDRAIATVARLRAAFPERDIELVVDATPRGVNRKVANLVNMAPRIKYEIVVLADSDIGVAPDYLQRAIAPLADPTVGAVTCLYRGVAVGGFWAAMSALAIDAHFLPGVLVGLRTRLAKPCFGSTIALTRARLAAIGGFEAVAHLLADDYAIGAAVRAQGLRVVVPDIVVSHACAEGSFLEAWRHELRWARTNLSLDPAGYAGSLVTHPLGWAILAMAAGAPGLGALAAGLAIACRMLLLRAVARRFDLPRPAYRLVPLRDALSFVVFLGSFGGRGVAWRGQTYQMGAEGRLLADRGST